MFDCKLPLCGGDECVNIIYLEHIQLYDWTTWVLGNALSSRLGANFKPSNLTVKLRPAYKIYVRMTCESYSKLADKLCLAYKTYVRD